MHVSISLVWLVSLYFSSTTSAVAISNADITLAERAVPSENVMAFSPRDVPSTLAKRIRKAAPITKAEASPNAPAVLFKRDCMVYDCDPGVQGPGPHTFATLVRLFKEHWGGGNFRIAEGQNYCVSCSGGMLGFTWHASYVFTENAASFDKHMSCIDPNHTSCIIMDGNVWPYGGYHYGYSHHWNGGDAPCRKC